MIDTPFVIDSVMCNGGMWEFLFLEFFRVNADYSLIMAQNHNLNEDQK